MNKSIEILIKGPSGSGKSAIAQEIVDKLREVGLYVKWDVSPEHTSEFEVRKIGVERLKRLEIVSDKTPVLIKEINIRDFNDSLNYRVNKYTNNNNEE